MIRVSLLLLSPLLPGFVFLSPLHGAEKPVQVFIFAGQSNMEGKAPNELLEHQGTDVKTKDLVAHLRRDGKWVVRDDVFIKFLDRKGPLTVGFGPPGRTGMELEFGTIVGSCLEESVILTKAAWGKHSLYKLFRSPSAGLPEEMIKKELVQAQERITKADEKNKKNDPLPAMEDIRKDYGASYRNMLAEVKNVKAFRTDVLVDKAAEKLYLTLQKSYEQWKQQGSDHAHHYLGSEFWFTRIGHAMGEATTELLDARK